MKRRDFLAGSAGLAGTLIPGFATAQSRPCPPGTVSAIGGTSTSAGCPATDPSADWQRRISTPGVRWYHRFADATEVSRFTPKSRIDDGRVIWSPNGGPQGQGCVRCITPANPNNELIQGAGNNTMERPFAPQPGDPGYAGGPAFNPESPTSYFHGYYGHPDYHNSSAWLGHEFWLSMKMRVDPRRFSSAWKSWSGESLETMQAKPWRVPNPSSVFVSPEYGNFADGGKGPCWLIARQTNAQEIVTGPADGSAVLISHANYSYYPFYVTRTVNGVTYRYPQPNGEFDPSCDTRTNATGWSANGSMQAYKCYRYPSFYNWYLGTSHNEWHTYMVHVKLGHVSTADSTYELFVDDGDGVWKCIVSRTDLTIPQVGGSVPYMHDRTYIACSHNNYWFRDGCEQRFTDVIFSHQQIPPPAPGL